MKKNEIVLYQPDNTVSLEVRMENETVWLTQAQIAMLFGCSSDNVSLHLKNIYDEGEIELVSTTEEISVVRAEGKRVVTRRITHYNLDAILSVGYRVNSKNATHFRKWATKTLKEHILGKYAVNQRIERLEERVSEHDKKIDFFVRTALPPVQGIFFDGQIFDAYVFVANLIRSAKERVTLIDNYINESVLLMLAKRTDNVTAQIITRHITKELSSDLERHNQQYPPITITESSHYHDRFLIIDATVYHIGASLKDIGKKLFAFSKMEVPPELLVS